MIGRTPARSDAVACVATDVNAVWVTTSPVTCCYRSSWSGVASNGNVMTTLLEHALTYARTGWAVLPLKPREKTPLTKHAVNDATTDAKQIKRWWKKWPDANIGVACGDASGILVIDIDPRNDGDHTWISLTQDALADADLETLTSFTGGGGRHLVFEQPEGRTRGHLGEGIDIKNSGYIVAPPSNHPSGDGYLWDDPDAEILPLPPELLALIVRPELEHDGRMAQEFDPDDSRPGTRFNALTTWAELLEPEGWVRHSVVGEITYWTRPGKTGAISASTNVDNTDLLWVWSSSTDFEQEKGYDKFGAYALLHHGGDIAEAAKALKDTLPAHIDPSLFDTPRNVHPEDNGDVYEPAFPVDHFVARFIAYVNKQTDAHPMYAEAAALMLLAVATPAARIQLAPYPEGLRTNLYALLVGPSTRSRKSTVQGIAVSLLKRFLPHAVLPSRMTTEAMVQRLAAGRGVPHVWSPDEFGMIIAEVGKREFLRGVEELLLSLYGSHRYEYMTVRDTTVIIDPHLSVFGSTTPEALALAGPTAMLGGLLPRFAIVMPPTIPPQRAAGRAVKLNKSTKRLTNDLRFAMQLSQEEPDVGFEDEALEHLNEVESGLTHKIHSARLPAMLYKVAALSALGDGRTTVALADARSAGEVVQHWAAGAAHLQPFLRQKAHDIEYERQVRMVLEALDALGGEQVKRSAIARAVAMPSNLLDSIQNTLLDRDLVSIHASSRTWTREA